MQNTACRFGNKHRSTMLCQPLEGAREFTVCAAGNTVSEPVFVAAAARNGVVRNLAKKLKAVQPSPATVFGEVQAS